VLLEFAGPYVLNQYGDASVGQNKSASVDAGTTDTTADASESSFFALLTSLIASFDLHEWRFRLSLDRHACYFGMLTAAVVDEIMSITVHSTPTAKAANDIINSSKEDSPKITAQLTNLTTSSAMLLGVGLMCLW
jgi:hypothetical protein